MTCAEAAKLSHAAERERVLSKARQMRAAMGLPADKRLAPELVLSAKDRL